MMTAQYNASLALSHVGWSILKRRLATDCVLQKDLDTLIEQSCVLMDTPLPLLHGD